MSPEAADLLQQGGIDMASLLNEEQFLRLAIMFAASGKGLSLSSREAERALEFIRLVQEELPEKFDKFPELIVYYVPTAIVETHVGDYVF